MLEVFRENYVGNFIEDVISALKGKIFDQIVWVGMHGWMQYTAKAIWKMGWKMDTAITNSDSRWGQNVCSEEMDHPLYFMTFEVAKKIGNSAVYIIANNHVDSIINQLTSYGIEVSRILVFETGKEYLDKANKELEGKYLNGLTRLSHNETQKALFEIMKVFKNFCEENGLRYYNDWRNTSRCSKASRVCSLG